MHLAKSGIRVLGIAESYRRREYSTLAGVVMRRDLVIDGMGLSSVTVGGSDATEATIKIFDDLRRKDINCLMLSGCVISWFNIIDPGEVSERTGLPVVAVTYEQSDGLADDIRYHFPDDDRHLAAYLALGERTPFRLHTGYEIYCRAWDIGMDDARRICNAFTKSGKIPEPLRVARLMARAYVRYPGYQ